MSQPNSPVAVASTRGGEAGATIESSHSAISWASIIAGGVIAAALSLILLLVGVGLGLTSISPWANSGVSATTFTVWAAVWLIIVQWLSSALGGYLSGRLRTKWVGVHNDEVFFRDTAHGLLAWAVATLLTVSVVASGATGVLSSGAQAVGGVLSGAAQGASQAAGQAASSIDPNAYLLDGLFRSNKPNPSGTEQEAKAEAGRILLTSVRNGSIEPADKTYLAQMIVSRTGQSQQEAEKRVDDAIAKAKDAAAKAKDAADQARKAAAKMAFYSFFSMLLGAFIACAAGAVGGAQRDEW
ncbi:hypothetical protein [Alsobacter sp. SYSU BS001988]